MGYYKVVATNDLIDFVEFTPLPNIESARRVAQSSGYAYTIIVDRDDKFVEVA